ncbi:hypothetical protein CDIK_0868 [Cucumispora dikerogammari]|nr:hypothetical protein CDIK_0868 [Cucumispora dikerogammari]
MALNDIPSNDMNNNNESSPVIGPSPSTLLLECDKTADNRNLKTVTESLFVNKLADIDHMPTHPSSSIYIQLSAPAAASNDKTTQEGTPCLNLSSASGIDKTRTMGLYAVNDRTHIGNNTKDLNSQLILQLEFFGFIPEQFLDELYLHLLKEIEAQISKLTSHSANLIYPELLNNFNTNYRIFKYYCLNFVFCLSSSNITSSNLLFGDKIFNKKLNIKNFIQLISHYKNEKIINENSQLELKRLQLMNENLTNVLKYKKQINLVLDKLNSVDGLIEEMMNFNKIVVEPHNLQVTGYLHFKENYAMKFMNEKEKNIKFEDFDILVSKMIENKKNYGIFNENFF